jgi:outer membrane beta-barrel protein
MPVVLMNRILILLAISLGVLAPSSIGLAYEKASDLNEVVLMKLFPKKKKIELDGRFGLVLNSSYNNTFLANLGLTYFWSEEWGFNVEGTFAGTQDKPERACIETFYNDPNYAVGAECGSQGDGAEGLKEDTDGDANFGPAYVPVRELKNMFIGNFVWNPIYGKQIVLMSATNYFDFYIKMGGGVAMSDFYAKQSEIPSSGKSSRGAFCRKQDSTDVKGPEGCTERSEGKNPGTTNEEETGVTGRPIPEAQSNLTMHLSIGQRFHFMKRFLVTASLENYTLLGTDSGFDNFLALMGGFGVRF